ncbi:MAG: condensation domain-containing protein [Candidatus Acidiferrales bacterium]
MQQGTKLDEAKRKLLERYARGDVKPAGLTSAGIAARPTGEPAPLSLAQEQLWIQEQVAGEAVPHNESVTIKANGWLDEAVLKRSLSELIRRHEIWRTSYETINGRPFQVVHPAPFEFPWRVVDLRSVTILDRDAQLASITSEAARQCFDLERGPLLRAMLIRLTDTDQRLFLFAHLSILDGVSVYQILPVELAQLYESFSLGQTSPLPELPIQYSDYAYWQRQWLKSDEPAKQFDYWREKLAEELPVANWPSRTRATRAETYLGAIQSFALSQSLTEALKQLSRNMSVTLFTVLVGCFSTLLFLETHQVEIIVGTPSGGGRKRSEVRALLGYFLNPVALRVSFQGNPSFQEILLRIQKVIAEAVSYDDVPIASLARALRPNAKIGSNPFFSIALSLQPQTPALKTGWHVTSMDVDSGGGAWGIYLAFLDSADGLGGRVQYNPDLFDRGTIVQMLQSLQELMDSIAANPGRTISALDSGQCRHAVHIS